MQPNRGEMQAKEIPINGLSLSSNPPTATVSAHTSLHDFHNSNNLQRPSSHFDPSAAAPDDFLDQMLSTIPSWPDLTKSHWDLTGAGGNKQLAGDDDLRFAASYDESSPLAARLRQHQFNNGGSLLLSAMAGILQSPANSSGADSGFLAPIPLSLEGPGPGSDSDSSFKSPNSTGVGFSASQQQHFHQPQGAGASITQQRFGGSPPAAANSLAISAGVCGGGAAGVAAPRQRVRARRGQATDPHSIAERLRRERITERMKALQELVPNANKTDKASMLDEIIEYVKFLRLQVKVLSMSRLGGSAADLLLEGRGSSPAASETVSETENLVAKLIEEDMGSAMQYLQGKGLCLMPISLASVISSVTSPSAAGMPGLGIPAGGDAPPSSPSMSVLTVQSAVAGCGGDSSVSRSSGKDAA